jgi:hypothetical protein
MAEINPSAIKTLRSRLITATVLTPDSDGYQDSLIRWSDTGRKQAVWQKDSWDVGDALTTDREW